MADTTKYNGITMMESVIYLGMFAMLFLTLMQFYFNIGQANQRSSATLNIQRFEIFLTEHLEDTMRNSDSFDSANSTTDVDLSTVRVAYGAGYKEYYVNDGTLYITDGTNTYAITSPNIDVKKFRADVVQDADTTMYRIDFTIEMSDRNITTLSLEHELFYILP